MRARRLSLALALAAGLLSFTAAPASAAPPANDEPPGAVAIRLGDRVEQDTSEATTGAQDDALNESCQAPATTASVWYSYSPAEDRKVVLDVTASDYSAGLLVFAGTPSARSFVTCGAGFVSLTARAGTTYTVMVISDTDVNGGRLVLSLEKAPPPPRVRVSVAGNGSAFRGGAGAARIHGTFACINGVFAGISSTLVQRAGRLKVRAETSTEVRCDGKRRNWSQTIVSPIGTYARGPAFVRVVIFACGLTDCRQRRTEREVRLSWAAQREPRGSVLRPSVDHRPRPLVRQWQRWPVR